MNGGAGYIGAMRLKEACNRFETYIKENKTKLASKFCELILKEKNAVLEAIKKV